MEYETAAEDRQPDPGDRKTEEVCVACDILKWKLTNDSSYNIHCILFVKHTPHYWHTWRNRASGFGNSGNVIHVGKYLASTLGINGKYRQSELTWFRSLFYRFVPHSLFYALLKLTRLYARIPDTRHWCMNALRGLIGAWFLDFQEKSRCC